MTATTHITFIGAGRLATNLATALHAQGHRIVQVFSRTTEAARALAQKVGATPCTDLAQIADGADLYLYAVKDDALETVIDAVAARGGLHAHTSGSVPMSVFAGKRANYGVLYPFQTFSKEKTVDFGDIPLFVDANNAQSVDNLKNIAATISQKVYKLSDEDRLFLHLAGVFANNFSNSLYVMASEILATKQLPFDLLLPLITESVGKLRSLAPIDAQTGPAARGDWQTIDKQRQLLAARPDLLRVYDLLTDNIMQQQKNNIR